MPKDSVVRKIKETAGVLLAVACLDCKRETNHEVLASVDVEGEAYTGDNSVQCWVNYQIVQCKGCESTAFRKVSKSTEDYDQTGRHTIEPNESVQLFPSRNTGRTVIKDAHVLPSNVQRIYEETIGAMNNDQPVLAGIGIRAIVETICKDKSAAGKILADRIDKLVVLGVLTSDGAAILHKLRTLGNEAAHEVKPHKSGHLGLALDVCEHLMQGVYILPFNATKTFL